MAALALGTVCSARQGLPVMPEASGRLEWELGEAVGDGSRFISNFRDFLT